MSELDVIASLSLGELIAGLASEDLSDHHELLLRLSSNYVAEHIDDLTEQQTISAVESALSKLNHSSPVIVNLCLIMLCNLTIAEKHATIFLKQIAGTTNDPLLVRKFNYMMDEFLSYNPQAEGDNAGSEEDYWSVADPFGHTASILCNISCTDMGREVLLKRSKNYIPQMIIQFRSKNAVRRRGAIASLRSCLFNTDVHWWLLYEVEILSAILLPLVVPTPFTDMEKTGMDPLLWMQAKNPDKRPDADKEILKMLLESLLLLCQRRGLREELRKRKVYPVIRNLDLYLEDDGINAVVLDLVDMLIRDEEPVSADADDAVPDEYRELALKDCLREASAEGGVCDEVVDDDVEAEVD